MSINYCFYERLLTAYCLLVIMYSNILCVCVCVCVCVCTGFCGLRGHKFV